MNIIINKETESSDNLELKLPGHNISTCIYPYWIMDIKFVTLCHCKLVFIYLNNVAVARKLSHQWINWEYSPYSVKVEAYMQATHQVLSAADLAGIRVPPKLVPWMWTFPHNSWLDSILNVCRTEDNGSDVVISFPKSPP